MDMLSPVPSSSYSEHTQSLARISIKVASGKYAVSVHLHELCGVGPTEVIDVTVTCNGTWLNSGFTATHGAVVVIAW